MARRRSAKTRTASDACHLSIATTSGRMTSSSPGPVTAVPSEIRDVVDGFTRAGLGSQVAASAPPRSSSTRPVVRRAWQADPDPLTTAGSSSPTHSWTGSPSSVSGACSSPRPAHSRTATSSGSTHDGARTVRHELEHSVLEVQYVVDEWLEKYNHGRVHRGLGGQTPAGCAKTLRVQEQRRRIGGVREDDYQHTKWTSPLPGRPCDRLDRTRRSHKRWTDSRGPLSTHNRLASPTTQCRSTGNAACGRTAHVAAEQAQGARAPNPPSVGGRQMTGPRRREILWLQMAGRAWQMVLLITVVVLASGRSRGGAAVLLPTPTASS